MAATCWWTEEQVKALQEKLNVEQIGILNKPTWDALTAALGLDSPKKLVGYAVKEHRLYCNGEQVSWKVSPNHGGVIVPEVIVVHYTGSNSLQSALSWLCDRKSKVSAHLVVAKTGQIWQLIPFNLRAWHAGRSEYNGRSDVNSFSIGIENVGLGDEWPEAQIQANIDIINALCRAYQIAALVGHNDVAIPVGRKVDPGPKYPWIQVCKATGFAES